MDIALLDENKEAEGIKLIAENEELDARVREGLEGTFLKSPELFIHLFNENFVSGNNPQIKACADNIVEAYKNVAMASKKLVILDTREVAIREMEESLVFWDALVKLKIAVEERLRDGSLHRHEEIILYEGGDFGKRVEDDEQMGIDKFGSLTKAQVKSVFERLEHETNDAGDVALISQEAIYSLDDQFILDTWELFRVDTPQKTA